MFGFSKIKRPDTCPVSDDNRIWLENSFVMLLEFFGIENTQQRRVLIPHYSDFPIKYDGSEETAFDSLKIIADQMEVPYEKIVLDFYDEDIKEISTGSIHGNKMFLNREQDEHDAAGLYWGKGEDEKYNISLVRSKLHEPENMIATLSHEIAHIKLLGENRIDENDEKLTDLTTVFFGLGIFNSNASFQTFNNVTSTGWRSIGYLSQMEWGYALALHAYVRGEKKPDWINYLTLNIKGDFIQGQNYIEKHPDRIFYISEE